MEVSGQLHGLAGFHCKRVPDRMPTTNVFRNPTRKLHKLWAKLFGDTGTSKINTHYVFFKSGTTNIATVRTVLSKEKCRVKQKWRRTTAKKIEKWKEG
jgi:hypothetical protein